MFCKHDWKLLSEITTKSKFEVAFEAIRDKARNSNLPWPMNDVSRQHIQVFTCNKCGKLKRFIKEI